MSASVDESEIYSRTADNRRLVAEVAEGLTPDQLTVHSLCSEWTAHEVIAHLAMPMLVSMRRLVVAALRHRGSFDRASAAIARELAKRPAHELAGVLRDQAEMRFKAPGVGPMGQLSDTSIHLRDFARPLGLDADVPLDTWRIVLDWLPTKPAVGGFVARGTLDGLRLEATDQDWVWGEGAEVRGPSEAIAMAITGRTTALADLTGPGADLLRTRSTG